MIIQKHNCGECEHGIRATTPRMSGYLWCQINAHGKRNGCTAFQASYILPSTLIYCPDFTPRVTLLEPPQEIDNTEEVFLDEQVERPITEFTEFPLDYLDPAVVCDPAQADSISLLHHRNQEPPDGFI